MTESVESAEILSSNSERKLGSDSELFVICLNYNSHRMGKPINHYLDLFINTSLNHMLITTRLISKPNNNLKLNCEQL